MGEAGSDYFGKGNHKLHGPFCVFSLRVGIAGMVLYLGYILERRSERNTRSLVQGSQAGGHGSHLRGREAA